ncbi:hypothetical protein K438DRAFT_1884667 [Mycena galopus ATCC 62051]|nr:hypothetical protein K438DRAFT_1884667 [Mycena galopus ATCC 62051]
MQLYTSREDLDKKPIHYLVSGHFAHHTWPLPLRPAAYISTTLAKLTNHTIDESSPDVIYGHDAPILQLQCNPSNCPVRWTNQMLDGTSTITPSSIIVPFTAKVESNCSAEYVFLNAVGGCVVATDNVDVGAWNNTPSPDSIKLADSNTSLCSEPHVLVIAPGRADVDIELDYIMYTVDVKDPHVGAIVGVVIGGIAVLGWRPNQRRRILNFQRRKVFLNSRGVPLGGGESDKDYSSIKMVLREKP